MVGILAPYDWHVGTNHCRYCALWSLVSALNHYNHSYYYGVDRSHRYYYLLVVLSLSLWDGVGDGGRVIALDAYMVLKFPLQPVLQSSTSGVLEGFSSLEISDRSPAHLRRQSGSSLATRLLCLANSIPVSFCIAIITSISISISISI